MAVAEVERAARPDPRAEVACSHCGLPVPRGLVDAGAAEQFCCSGCRTAWSILRGHGLDQYYRLPEQRRFPVRPSGKSFEEFDHPAFRELYVRSRNGAAEIDLYLEGVHCASCVWLVERVPLLVPGTLSAELNVTRALVHVTWDEGSVPLSEIARALDRLGYRPHPFRGIRAEAVRRSEDRAMIGRIGIAGAIAMNVMLLALALYSGWFTGMEREYERYFRWLSLVLVTPAVFGPGLVFFRGAWSALRARTLHMDLPIALALAAGYARGAVNTITDHGPIYFDGVAALVFLLLVGRFLQLRAQRAAADASELLHSLSPRTARVLDAAGTPHDIPAEALLPEMVCEVRSGDTLAADGVVISGEAEVDLALLTGESRPQPVAPGDEVFAGTVNRGPALRVRVTVAGEQSRLGRILLDVERGAQRRAPVVQTADRLAGAFVAVVLALAAVTFAIWVGRDASAAADHAIALLIVTCPCALALATPLAVTVAIGRAARAGILIKGGDALERLARPGRMILDKTGTVTEGRPSLVHWQGPEEVKPWIVALERNASHPIAAAFAAAWPEVEDTGVAEDVRVTAGAGIEGTVAGRRVVVGSPAHVAGRLAAGGAAVTEVLDPVLTPVWVAVDGRVAATAGFGDAVRADAAVALGELRHYGWRTSLLSGDHAAVVGEVGARLGFAPADVRGGASPEDKLAAVERAECQGGVVMVGDGVNDAAAIARAGVGVGVRGGAEACLAAADVFLARPGLAPLVQLTRGARRTLGVIRRNIAFSLLYNLAGATLAVTGVINPLLAAILMPASSLTVVLASWLGRTFEEPRP